MLESGTESFTSETPRPKDASSINPVLSRHTMHVCKRKHSVWCDLAERA